MAYTVPTISGYTLQYESNKTGKSYKSGATLPTIEESDILSVYKGNWSYTESYYYRTDKSPVGWYLEEIDGNVTEYSQYAPILSSINGKNVVAIQDYDGGSPISLDVTQFSLTIPSTIKRANYLFYGREALEGLITINATLTSYTNIFKDTVNPIKLKGSGANLQALANTSNNGNVSVYIPFSINLLTQRCDSDGMLNDEGTSCLVTLEAQGDPVNTIYTASFDIGGNQSTQTFTLSSTDKEQVAQFVIDGNFDVDTTYACNVSVTDSWGTNRTMTDNLTTGFFTIDIKDGGKEIAFGTSANDEDIPKNGLFKCSMDANFLGNTYANGNITANEHYTSSQTISLGDYICTGVLSTSGGHLRFSIPTGRVFPTNYTISRLQCGIAARAGSSNGSGKYIIKSTSGGYSAAQFDSAASTKMTFYNANDAKKTVTSGVTVDLQGNTNINVIFNNLGDHFFTGTSTITGYCNNQPTAIIVSNIILTLTT